MKTQSKPTLKPVILCAAIAGMLTAATNAADITWQTPASISGATDVSTLGTYFGSWAPYNQAAVDAGGLAVNGVLFQAFSDLPGLNTSGFDSGYGSYNNPNTANANYNALLQSAAYNGTGSGTPTISWGNMTIGNTYLLQFWANDGRGNGRTQTITGGANTSGVLNFGDAPGQFIIGTFVADSTSQTITLTGSSPANGNYPQVNLLQVREINAVPEPSKLVLFAIGAGAMLCRRRRKCRAV